MQHGRCLSWIASTTVVLSCYLLPGAVFADGVYIPERAVKKVPSIPTQRAILTYKDQSERLIIESTLDAEGKRFGWIIPVPARPVDIAEVSPGLLNSLSLYTRAPIIHDMSMLLKEPAFLAAAITIWAAYVLSQQAPSRRKMLWSVPAFLAFLIILLVFSSSLSAGGSERGERSSGVDVHDAQTVGNYEVAVLQAHSAEALGQWLDENDFSPLPSRGNAIVDDYIRQGWHFVTAKLRRDGSGVARPHPLSITFPTAHAVYPMRLTGLAGSPLALELYVAGDQMATVKGLAMEFADVMGKDTHPDHIPAYVSRNLELKMAHPELDKVLWDGACLVRLTGVVQLEDMQADFLPEWQAPSPHRPYFFSHSGAWPIAALASIFIYVVGVPVGFIVARGRVPDASWHRFCIKRIAGPTVVISVLVGGGIYLVLPKVDVEGIGLERIFLSPFTMERRWGSHSIQAMAIESHGSIEEFRRLLADYFRYLIVTNPYTYDRMNEEDSPGNYAIESDAGGFLFTQYGQYMERSTVYLPANISAHSADRSAKAPTAWFDPDIYEKELAKAQRDAQQLLENPSPQAWRTMISHCQPYGLDLTRRLEIVRLGRQNPQEVVPLLVEDMRQALTSEHGLGLGHQVLVESLGEIVEVPPPLDFHHPDKAAKFLAQVESQLRRMPATQQAAQESVPGSDDGSGNQASGR